MNASEVLDELIAGGVLDSREAWTIESATGGLNSRVFRVQAGDSHSGFTVRVRDDGSFDSEVEALADVAACPGVPGVIFASDEMLVHDYLPGRPQPLGERSTPQLGRLAVLLACLHRHTYSGYTPWPKRERTPGTFGDLFRFRVRSLQNYASYSLARSGELDPRLPELLDRLSSSATLNDPSWDDERFARLHGDLSFGNILWSDDSVALIDWEFSRAGDPAEDLGYLLTEQPVERRVIGGLRALYIAAGGDEPTWSRVPAYALFTAVDSVLWWADYPATPSLDIRNEIDRRIAAALNWSTARDSS